MSKKPMNYLSEDFLVEILKICITTPSFADVARSNLEFQYFPTVPYKRIWKEMSNSYDLDGKMPTIGVLREALKDDSDCSTILAQIKKCDVFEGKDKIIQEFEKFLITVKFKTLHLAVTQEFNTGDPEKAIQNLIEGTEHIKNFSIVSQTYSTVFKDFEKRNEERVNSSSTVDINQLTKVPFGIHPLDYYTRGGADIGRSYLFMAVSGGGKSTLMRWIGICAARLGLRVVHFQCEGTKQEALDAYDAAWTSIDLEEIELGNIPRRLQSKVQLVNKDIIDKGGEIYVIANEQFDEMYVEDCDARISDIERHIGKVHLAIFDYLEIMNVKGYFKGSDGERKRRTKIGEKITNIATKYKLVSISATQANDIKPEKLNDPDFVMTRSDISEFKGAIRPFSGFITINQTDDEYEAGIARLHNDKFRKYKSGQTYRVAQSLDNSRFYDSMRTLDLFWDEENKKPKRIATK